MYTGLTDCVSYFVASTYNKENVGRLLRATLHAWSSPQCESQQPLMMNTLTVYRIAGYFRGCKFSWNPGDGRQN